MFGGPKSSGAFDGLQAEIGRVPFANVGLVKLPDEITNDQAVLLSDIFPSGYFAAELAEVTAGDVVAVFGCGPVGQFAILSAQLLGAGRVLAVDHVKSRLDAARDQGAEVIDFDADQPVQALLELTHGIGPDRVIDAVGIDARGPCRRLDTPLDRDDTAQMERQRSQVAPEQAIDAPGGTADEAPAQALQWAVESIAKSGTLAIVGVYPPRFETFPLGKAFERNLTVKMGVCHHRRYIPKLVEMVASGAVNPARLIPRPQTLFSAIEAYEKLDRGEAGWLPVAIAPSS
jgi:threonine dehydrogenase-like Zn-dependent dehydrogenase